MYICPDRIVEERKTFNKLLAQLSEKLKSESGEVHFINNNYISSERDI